MMNVQVTNTKKYSNVNKIYNYGAELVSENRVDGHLSIIYIEDKKEWTEASFGIKDNTYLEDKYGFRFVNNEKNIDNSKYYF